MDTEGIEDIFFSLRTEDRKVPRTLGKFSLHLLFLEENQRLLAVWFVASRTLTRKSTNVISSLVVVSFTAGDVVSL